MDCANVKEPPSLDVNISPIADEYFKNCDLFKLKNLFKCDEAVRMLAQEVESLPFDYSVNDLHSLAQTADLVKIADSLPPLTCKLLNLIRTKVRAMIEELFDVKTKEEITITASKYNKGDYLLCHDDLCKDRHIAFVYYLSDTWKETDGGALRFFELHPDTKEPLNRDTYRKVLLPVFNSLVAFRVSKTSYHEVQQVLSDKSRISINGWFHCEDINSSPQKNNEPSEFIRSPILQFVKFCDEVDLTEVVQTGYLNEPTVRAMSKELLYMAGLSAVDFLKSDLYEGCLLELQGDLPWTMMGPANHRKYEVFQVDVNENGFEISDKFFHLKWLLQGLVSPNWLRYLTQLTNLEFAVLSEQNFPPTCMIEIQRWREGCYSLLADNDFEKQFPTLEVTLFFGDCSEIVGSETSSLDNEDLSGHIVQSVKGKKNEYSSSYYKALATIKYQRIKAELRKTSKYKSLQGTRSRYSHPGIKRLVDEKTTRIKQFRSRDSEEINIFQPGANTMVLTMNCDSAVKFTSFIRHSKSKSQPNPCYYAVTISYLTTCAYYDRSSESTAAEGDFLG